MSEKCGFVLHAILVPAMVLYAGYAFPVAWEEARRDRNGSKNELSFFGEISEQDSSSHSLPQLFWALVLPSSLLVLYLATYILYFAINSSIATTVSSTDCLFDVHTRPPPTTSTKQNNSHVSTDSLLYPIYDQDVREVNERYRTVCYS